MKNVVREHINEKFTQDSDPIADMNIGGILLKPEFDKLYKEFKEKWVKYLWHIMPKYEGKKVKGEFRKNQFNAPYKTYTFIIKNISFYFQDKNYYDKKHKYDNYFTQYSIY